MNDKLTFTGGEPKMNEDDFLRIQKANREFIQNLLNDFGECIISGEILTDPGTGNDLTLTEDAFVFLDGEVLKVDAGTYSNGGGLSFWKYVKQTTYESGGDKTYQDGIARQTWQKNRAIPTSVSSLGAGDLDVINGRRWNGILRKVINIGSWDMNASISVNIAHGVSDFNKIRGVQALIYPDTLASLNPIDQVNPGTGIPNGWVSTIGSTNITLQRYTGGQWDSAGYDDTTINRGFILIDYEL